MLMLNFLNDFRIDFFGLSEKIDYTEHLTLKRHSLAVETSSIHEKVCFRAQVMLNIARLVEFDWATFEPILDFRRFFKGNCFNTVCNKRSIIRSTYASS